MEVYSEVFYYCLQEAIYWKLIAEIYYNSEQDKKRIQDPTKASSCIIHSENDVTKYVYIPTDKENIDEDKIELELTKVGLGARSGVDNVMLVVKEFEECKKQNTLDMISKLSHYGGEFKERGMVMVTEERKLIDDNQPDELPETESNYFKNEADDYSDILKILIAENRVFCFDKKRVDKPKMGTEMGEFFNQEREDRRSIDNLRKIQNSAKIVQRATEGVKHTSILTQTGMNVYRNMYTASKGVDIQGDRKIIDQVVINQVWEAKGFVDKLRTEEVQYVEERRKIETGGSDDIQMERQRMEQAEANRILEEEQRRNLEIEMEKLKLERVEKDRMLVKELEREREREKMERDRELRQEIESRSEDLKQLQHNGEDHLRKIRECLDECEKKNYLKYLEVKCRYEELVDALKKTLLDDDDLERKLRALNALIIELIMILFKVLVAVSVSK